MRGARLVGPLVAVVLLAAGGIATAGADASDPGTPLAAGITWFAPDHIQVGHPVHAAVAVLTGDGYGTETHQNLAIQVTLDDAVLFETPSVHEHHGIHVLTVTPMWPGTLRLWAGDPGDTHQHLHRAQSLLQGDPTGGAVHTITVEGAPLAVADLVRLEAEAKHDVADASWHVTTATRDVPFTALHTLRDGEGRLLASAWARGTDGAAVQHAASPAILGAEMIVLPDPGASTTPYAETVQISAEGSGPLLSLQLPEPTLPELCADNAHRLVLDPTSLAPAVPAWQEWSDVRVHLLDPARLGMNDPEPITYEIWPLPLLTPLGATYTLEAADPLGFATFRVTQLGPHLLVVRDASGGLLCQAPFLVLPGPGVLAMTPGKLDVVVHETGTGAHVELRSLTADGAGLPHYEFDVRVVRVADDDGPGFLAWRGKLHGHDGEVEFAVSNLPRGEYEMRVYPSPQDAELPPLAAGPDGFLATFHVADGPSFASQETPEPEVDDAPATPLVVVLVVLGALVLIVRRRR